MAQSTHAIPEMALEDLVRVPGVQGFDLAPDGRQAVIVWNAGGSPQLYVVPLDGSAPPRQITEGPQAAMSPRWSPRGDLIAFTRDTGGDENANIFLISRKGGRRGSSPTRRARPTSSRPGRPTGCNWPTAPTGAATSTSGCSRSKAAPRAG